MANSSSSNVPFVERWAAFAVDRRWLVLGAWFVALVALGFAAVTWGGEYSDNFEVPGTESQAAIDLLSENFPARAGGTSDIVFRAENGVDDPAVAERMEALYAEVAALPGIAEIETHFDNRGYVSQRADIARAVVRWEEEPGEVTPSLLEPYLEVVDAANGNGLTVETGGGVVSFNEGEEPGGTSEMIGIVAAAIILVLAFGSIVAAGVPILMALFGLGAAFAGMALIATTGFLPSFAPAFGAMIGIGVGIDYSLLVVTRYREGLHAGLDVKPAIVRAIGTSGRSVFFAGIVVAVSFLGLALMGLPFVTALGAAGAIVVLCAVLVAMTLLPAVLSLLGHRVDSLFIPFLRTREGVSTASIWYRLSRNIQRRPLPWFAASAGFVLLLCSPLLDLNLGVTDDGNRGETFHSRRAYDLLAEGFGPGFNSPLTIVVDGEGAGERAETVRAAVESHPNVVNVTPSFGNGGSTAVFTVFPGTRPQDEATADLVHDLRNDVFPGIATAEGVDLYVTGAVPAFVDIGDRISGRLIWLFVGVIGISFVLLTAVFRSVVVAVKAAILNLMSIGAAFGVLIAIFQWGWFADVVGVEPGPIEVFLPMMLFAILFGLSMDYEVFLISRIREEYLRTGDNGTAVANGLAVTARVITAAAAIMCFVFFSFAFGDDRIIKLFGLGLGSAILVDATIIRLILVPSTMALLGNRNWWLPSWLDRLLPNINIEGHTEIELVLEPQPEAAAAPAGGGGN